MQRHRGIAFIGTYLPRACGLATFTYDLVEAVARRGGRAEQVIVAAMNDIDGYSYPERVRFELRQDFRVDYSRAADFLNYSRIDVVCLQHEYGIFGGEAGSNVLALLRDLRRPLVVTCHTVLAEPEPAQKEVLVEIAARAEKLVAMSEKACSFLEDVYGVSRDKIVHVPHGIHEVPFIDPSFYKDKFGLEGRRVLITFGLLHRNKGIEHVIEAMPRIVERHPRAIYIVLGATHPAIVREEGESYRLSLQRRVRELGLEDHVIFYPRFVDLDELLEYLGASDIVVTPYILMDHTTSGPLIYAMGSGKAAVSTPYWYAKELLKDGRGVLVKECEHESFAEEINSLLDDEVKLSAIRKKAYSFTRSMVWSAVARDYIGLFEEVRHHPEPMPVAKTSSVRHTLSATNLPHPRLDHLARLTDDTGPARWARYSVPDWNSGYHLEDTSCALVATTKYREHFGDPEASRLASRYLALIQVLIGDGGSVLEGLDYTRHSTGKADSTAIGKAAWALGYVVSRGQSQIDEAANDIFNQLLPRADLDEPRAAGHAVLGTASYLVRFQGATEIKRCLSKLAKRLEQFCSEPGWIERWGGPDWPVAAQAMLVAGSILENETLRKRGKDLVGEILERTRRGTIFLRPGDNPDEEELPITTATFIEALGAEFQVTRDSSLLGPMRSAADWFLGANREGESLYDFTTAGCHDAITASGLNRNQGTEATVFCLLAFLSLHEFAGAR